MPGQARHIFYRLLVCDTLSSSCLLFFQQFNLAFQVILILKQFFHYEVVLFFALQTHYLLSFESDLHLLNQF